jgi:predicted AlkP superfamily pyrophosphatase or phosphodiesterase
MTPKLPLRLQMLLAAVLLAACSAPTTQAPSATVATGERPRLVVFMAVDGLPQRQVVAYRDQLVKDGFARFLDQGAWYSDAHYRHGFTVTAAGHATMLTGAYPHRTGIIGNQWKDPATGADVYCTGDTSATYIGNPTKPLDGTSPRNLKVQTLGVVLRKVDSRSKVIAISGKDRGAILPGGHAGTAYMYQSTTGQFASSTYYMPRHPAWVDAFNNAKPADRWFKGEWKPLLPDAAYARSLPDKQPWYGANGQLPRPLGGANEAKPGPAYYASLLPGPYADMLSLEFARAAIAGEQLGADDAPDILSVSLSGHDYVNHQYSAESRLSHDHFLQLDRMLEAFFRDLDAKVGRDRYVLVLTADHGFGPSPEYMATKGEKTGRIQTGPFLQKISDAVEWRFNAKLVKGLTAAGVLLDRAAIRARGVDPEAVAQLVRDTIVTEPGIAVAYTAGELRSNSRAGAPHFDALRRAYHPDVSGDVLFAVRPYWLLGRTPASHGTPYDYDNTVPILMWGPKWVNAGQRTEAVEVVDIAPTIAKWLQIPPPATAEGKVLGAAR